MLEPFLTEGQKTTRNRSTAQECHCDDLVKTMIIYDIQTNKKKKCFQGHSLLEKKNVSFQTVTNFRMSQQQVSKCAGHDFHARTNLGENFYIHLKNNSHSNKCCLK